MHAVLTGDNNNLQQIVMDYVHARAIYVHWNPMLFTTCVFQIKGFQSSLKKVNPAQLFTGSRPHSASLLYNILQLTSLPKLKPPLHWQSHLGSTTSSSVNLLPSFYMFVPLTNSPNRLHNYCNCRVSFY